METLSIPSGISHSFIGDTGRAESIISDIAVLSFHPILGQHVKPYGSFLPILEFCLIPNCISDSSPVNRQFLISYSGPSILGLDVLCKSSANFSFLTVQHDIFDVRKAYS